MSTTLPPDHVPSAGAELSAVQVVSSVFGPGGEIVSPCPWWLRRRMLHGLRDGLSRYALAVFDPIRDHPDCMRGYTPIYFERREWRDRRIAGPLTGVFLSDAASAAAWLALPERARLHGPPFPLWRGPRARTRT